jgi:acetamidase/formamidase
MRNAVMAAMDFLVDEQGLAPGEAFTFASLAVDFAVAEAVNQTQVVTAAIPKSLLLER